MSEVNNQIAGYLFWCFTGINLARNAYPNAWNRMKEKVIDCIATYIYQRSRLSFTSHKKAVLKQRLEERMRQLNLTDLAAYWEYIQKTPQEEAVLYDLLTTNETFFFRNHKQFDYLKHVIIPSLEDARGQEVIRSWGNESRISPQHIMKLRILCAGCSSGEEPYSLAMTLLEALRYPRAWDIEILAGDLSENCIKVATKGYYPKDRLKGLPQSYVERYMERTADGAIMNGMVKRLIRFHRLNLGDIIKGMPFPMTPPGFVGFDVIFCRNVLIYLSTEAQQQLVDILSRSLVPGGYLFTGDAEPLHLYSHDLETVSEAGCLIYRKMERGNDVVSH